jgi:hypothetical protein
MGRARKSAHSAPTARAASERNPRSDVADFLDEAEWKYKNLSFEKWNNAFDLLKAKLRRKQLHDPFEKYLHDTYFPLREKASKRRSNDSRKEGSAPAVHQYVTIHS